MTPTKLITIALGLAAITTGALLLGPHPAVALTLGTVGGKLLGLIWPELGAKKAEP